MQIVDEIEKSVHYLAEKCNRNFYRLAITEKLWYAPSEIQTVDEMGRVYTISTKNATENFIEIYGKREKYNFSEIPKSSEQLLSVT